MFKKVLLGLLIGIFILIPTISSAQYAYGEFPCYRYDDIGNKDRFTNYVDGYSIDVPKGMSVDMSMSELRAVLNAPNYRIEIYRQDNVSPASYINYGNKFINNTIDHIKEYSANTTINGKSAYVLQWRRNKLSKVEHDKNYYATVDITLNSNSVMTFVFESEKPLNQSVDYMSIVKSMKLTDRWVKPYAFRSNSPSMENKNAATKKFYEEVFLKNDGKLEWGLFQPDYPLTENLKNIESKADHFFDFVVFYTHIKDSDLTKIDGALAKAREEGRVVELTLQTRFSGAGEPNPIYEVLNGKYDLYLTTYAKQVAEHKEPVLLRVGNEMNGDWCPYSGYNTSKDADIYIEFYKYVYNIFEKEGANANTLWVWNPNGKSFPNFKWNHELAYYPGDKYVDIVGMTAYNTGNFYPGEKWTEFDQLYSSLYNTYLNRYSQPLMITEFACSSYGGNKAKWVENMFTSLQKYPMIKAAIWWNGADYTSSGQIARPYFITDVPEVLEIFKKNVGGDTESTLDKILLQLENGVPETEAMTENTGITEELKDTEIVKDEEKVSEDEKIDSTSENPDEDNILDEDKAPETENTEEKSEVNIYVPKK